MEIDRRILRSIMEKRIKFGREARREKYILDQETDMVAERYSYMLQLQQQSAKKGFIPDCHWGSLRLQLVAGHERRFNDDFD